MKKKLTTNRQARARLAPAALLDAIGSEWHDVLTEPPGRLYHTGFNEGLYVAMRLVNQWYASNGKGDLRLPERKP